MAVEILAALLIHNNIAFTDYLFTQGNQLTIQILFLTLTVKSKFVCKMYQVNIGNSKKCA